MTFESDDDIVRRQVIEEAMERQAEIGVIFNELINTELSEYELDDVVMAFHLTIATRLVHTVLKENEEEFEKNR